MNTTTKPGVLAVMSAARASFDNIRFERRGDEKQDAYWTGRIAEMIEARATVELMLMREQRAYAVLENWEKALAEFHGTTAAKAMMAICAKELRAALDV